ncbi:MAG TPA: hypothetical protein VF407_03355 [Polyangiaceae bacterium]
MLDTAAVGMAVDSEAATVGTVDAADSAAVSATVGALPVVVVALAGSGFVVEDGLIDTIAATARTSRTTAPST